MFQKKTLIVGFIVVALGLAFGTFFIRSNHKQDTRKVRASSDTATITTQADWENATLDNIDTTSSLGSIKIQTVSQETEIDLSTGILSGNLSGDSPQNVIDSNPETIFQGGVGSGVGWDIGWWQVDLQQSRGISKLIESCDGIPGGDIPLNEAYCSVNGTDFTNLAGTKTGCSVLYGNYYDCTYSVVPQQCRYIRVISPGIQVRGLRLIEGEAEAKRTAILDSGANFWQWETFVDTKTVPANTSVAYRYRTSPDSTTWTGWVSSIGAVTSRTGDDSNNPTKYRYLQVEATLSNTDGTSTPTIDQYDIGYHTNQKPNKPTAMTAVVN